MSLRRTWGWELRKAGAPIEVISTMVEHRDTKTTPWYLRGNHDDQEEANNLLYARQQEVRAGTLRDGYLRPRCAETCGPAK